MKKKYLLCFEDFKEAYLKQINDCKNVFERIILLEFLLERLDLCLSYNFISKYSYDKAVIYLYDRLIPLKEAYNYEL